MIISQAYLLRKVLLLYPIMSSGNKVCKAIQVLKDHDVPEASFTL